MSKKKNKHNKQHRSLIEAQKAEIKSFEYSPVHTASPEVKKESDVMTHQLPIFQIRKDFMKIVLYLLFTITVLVYFKMSGLDLDAIKGFLRF